MLLGFKRRFAPFVEDGSKTHTIRAIRKNPPRVGEMCHCYVDPRQKTMRLLGRWPCVCVEEIEIRFVPKKMAYGLQIAIDGQVLSQSEADALAWRDGFRNVEPRSSLEQMAAFWQRAHALTQGSAPFRGHVIHWQWRARR